MQKDTLVHSHITRVKHRLFLGASLTCLGLAALTSSSAVAAEYSLAPFKAQYALRIDGSVTLTADATREVKKHDNDTWMMSIDASTFIATLSEQTQFRLHNTQIQPLRYEKSSKVFGKKRQLTIEFDWDKHQAISSSQAPQWTLSHTHPTFDRLSYQLELQKDIAEGKSTFRYWVSDGGEPEEYIFEPAGKASVETELGTFNSLRFERVYPDQSNKRTSLWFAPALDYQLVKLEQINRKGQLTRLSIKQLR